MCSGVRSVMVKMCRYTRLISQSDIINVTTAALISRAWRDNKSIIGTKTGKIFFFEKKVLIWQKSC